MKNQPRVYVKKALEVLVMQYAGGHENAKSIAEWMGIEPKQFYWKALEGEDLLVLPLGNYEICLGTGDYVVKGFGGEFYSCDQDVFEKNYALAPWEEARDNDMWPESSGSGAV